MQIAKLFNVVSLFFKVDLYVYVPHNLGFHLEFI